ncbi:MAG: RecX family transcriptional regulator, partial [Oscillospiraceae bacterium]
SQRRYAIYINNNYLTILDQEIIEQNNLKIGSVITAELYDKIFADAAFRKARERALHLLFEKQYSCKELFEKISKTNDEIVSQNVIDFLKQNNLLNDKKYAQNYAYEASEYKKWGKAKILFNLKQKGIENFDIEDALENFEFNGIKQVEYLMKTKFKNKIYEKNGLKKVFENLYKMGYSKDEINPVLEKYKLEIKQIQEQVPQEEKLKAIVKQIKTKYARKLESENGYQKVFASLARQGYEYSLVKQALERYYENENCN